MKLITRDTDYAVRALIYLAQAKQGITSVRELVKNLGVPRPFLRKILQRLNQKGVLKSYKGQGGGFSLALRPEKIFLVDLIKIFQRSFSLNECIFKKMICPSIKNCLLCKKLKAIENYVASELNSINLLSLMKDGFKLN